LAGLSVGCTESNRSTPIVTDTEEIANRRNPPLNSRAQISDGLGARQDRDSDAGCGQCADVLHAPKSGPVVELTAHPRRPVPQMDLKRRIGHAGEGFLTISEKAINCWRPMRWFTLATTTSRSSATGRVCRAGPAGPRARPSAIGLRAPMSCPAASSTQQWVTLRWRMQISPRPIMPCLRLHCEKVGLPSARNPRDHMGYASSARRANCRSVWDPFSSPGRCCLLYRAADFLLQ
jgi:hypothetical protein